MFEILERYYKIVLTGIFFLAAFLMIWGIWHDYPYSFYPDEAHFVKRSLSFGSGNLNPNWFHKPAFFMYILFFEYGLFFLIGKLLGVWISVADFAVFYIRTPGPFYIVGRMTVVVFCLGTIGMTYLCAKKLFDRRTGVFSAFILSLAPGYVMVAKDVKADIPCSFFTMAAAFFLICFTLDNRNKDILFAVALTGIGMATKTYSIVMLIPISIAILLRDKNIDFKSLLSKIKLVITSIFLCYFIFFLCSPFNFLDPRGREATFGRFISFGDQIMNKVSGHKEIQLNEDEPLNISNKIKPREVSYHTYINGVKSYVEFLAKGFGNILTLSFSIIGMIYLLIWQKNKPVFCFLFYPLLFIFLSIILHPGYAEIRHQVVVYPFFAITAAVFFMVSVERLNLNHYLLYVLIVIFLMPIITDIKYNVYISRQDTRNIAKEWIEKNIPPGSKILINENGPVLNNNDTNLKKILGKTKNHDPKGQFTAHMDIYLNYQLEAVKGEITYDIQEIRFPWWVDEEVQQGVHELKSEFHSDMGNPLKPVGVNPYKYYVENRFDYIIVHSQKYAPFFNPNSDISERFPSFASFYHTLFKKGVLIKEFSPEETKGPGYTVKIFNVLNDKT